MRNMITAVPLTAAAFAPYGQVIEPDEARAFPINAGKCMRHHDLARAVTTVPGDPVYLSIARGQPYDMPLGVALVERHPLGSQAFVPLSPEPFLVVVCPDEGGRPGTPVAFLTAPGQGVNYPPGLWHGVLTPLGQPQDFLIVDRAGADNLEEFHFDTPWTVVLPGDAHG